nr:hypothetical protein CFP56_31442 [Quercus suber]
MLDFGGGFLLVTRVRFVGLAMLDGVAIDLAMGCELWLWCWVFLLRLLGSDGGLMSGYSSVGFCWLCSGGGFLLVARVRFVGLAMLDFGGGFLLVTRVRFVGLAMLDGVAINLAMGCELWLRCWVFLLRLLGSDGGLMSGYSSGSLSNMWCWVGCAVGYDLVNLQR